MIKPEDMTNEQLLKAHNEGKIWVSNRMQVSETNKNVLGEIYNHLDFLAGLSRIEELEDQLILRNLI